MTSPLREQQTCTLHVEKQADGTHRVVYPDCSSEPLIKGQSIHSNPGNVTSKLKIHNFSEQDKQLKFISRQ